ncbi:DegT/DnrJ/EryC1/StrS family aminotransferase, partial [Roseiconus sp. JC912]
KDVRGQAPDEAIAAEIRLAPVKTSQNVPTWHCRLVSSGSLAVEMALRVLGAGQQNKVAVCAYDYPGNLRAIEAVGARPYLVDAAFDSYSISPKQLKSIPADEIQFVIASHLYGIPADVNAIKMICRDKGWKWIEDACQTPLMPIASKFAGSHGDLGTLSFGGSKPLTSGNGGAILTDSALFASKLSSMLERPSDASPLSPLQAAVLLPQLDRVAECNQKRFDTVRRLLDEVDWIRQATFGVEPASSATCYKLALRCQNRNEVLNAISELGIPCGAGFRSMHRSSRRRCDRTEDLTRCQDLGDQLCLVDHRALLAEDDQQDWLIETLKPLGGLVKLPA